MKTGAQFWGEFTVKCFDADGNLKWEDVARNLVVDEGLDYILDILLKNGTQSDPWYIGLKNSGTIAAGDTLASHAGWTENANYTGDRKEFVDGAISSQSVDNSGSPASFAIDTDGQTIAGAFMCDAATGTTGTLLCAADFSNSKSADSGDTLEVTYTFSAADDGV